SFGAPPLDLKLTSLTSMYRVTRDGFLRELDTEVTAQFVGEQVIRIKGEVKDDLFFPQIQFQGLGQLLGDKMKIEPIKVSAFGSVLNPLQPVNKLPGLRAGQNWRIPQVNPMDVAQQAVLAPLQKVIGQAPSVRYLNAEVSTTTFDWHGQPQQCLLIEYREA